MERTYRNSSVGNAIRLIAADAASMIKSSVATLSLYEKRSGHIRR